MCNKVQRVIHFIAKRNYTRSHSIWICFFIFCQMICNQKLASEKISLKDRPLNALYQWHPQWYRMLSMGHVASWIDWIWLRCILHSPVKPGIAGNHSPFFYDLELLTDLDPQFQLIYTAGVSLLAVIQRDGMGARDLLIRGRAFSKNQLLHHTPEFIKRYWPEAWRIPLLLAYVYTFELNDMRQAKLAFQEAAQMEGSPAYLKILDQRFRSIGGEYQVGIRLLKALEASTNDLKLKAEYKQKKLQLEIELSRVRIEGD